MFTHVMVGANDIVVAQIIFTKALDILVIE